jgi:hypothetical protein
VTRSLYGCTRLLVGCGSAAFVVFVLLWSGPPHMQPWPGWWPTHALSEAVQQQQQQQQQRCRTCLR